MGGLLSRVFGGGGNANTKKQKQALSSKDQAKLDLKRQRDRLTRDTKKVLYNNRVAKGKSLILGVKYCTVRTYVYCTGTDTASNSNTLHIAVF